MDTVGDQCLRVGEHADDDLQRHQYRIKRNTDKCTFARNAMIFGGLGSGGGRHLRSGLEKFNPCILPGTSGDAWQTPKKFLLNQLLI
jgi:hypothetical protein